MYNLMGSHYVTIYYVACNQLARALVDLRMVIYWPKHVVLSIFVLNSLDNKVLCLTVHNICCSRNDCWREQLSFWDGVSIQAWRKHHNDALRKLYVSSDVVTTLRLRKMCTRHVARMGQMTNARRELENLTVRGYQEDIGVDARKIINGSYRYMMRVCRLHLFDQTPAIAMKICVP